VSKEEEERELKEKGVERAIHNLSTNNRKK